MTQINSNNEEESNTEKTGQIEKLADDNNQNVNKSAYVESVEKILFMYSTAVSDVGTVRSNNQDSAFAGEHLAAICDGMGGHAGGDTASTIAIRSLAHNRRFHH